MLMTFIPEPPTTGDWIGLAFGVGMLTVVFAVAWRYRQMPYHRRKKN